MQIKVLYMGGSREQAGTSEETLELPNGATVQMARDQIAARHAKLAPYLASVRWARNYEFVELDAALDAGDELAVLPPVQGGALAAELTTEPLDPDAVAKRVAGPDAGATVLFIGTVRDQARGKTVSSLEYEAYHPMAARQLERIARECEAAHPGARVSISHRSGKLSVGETSVVIAVAAPHREAAYAANRMALERIKEDVPIWKRETSPSGESWVGWGGG